VNGERFSDAWLVVLGHGTEQNANSAAPVYQHAAELRRRSIFAGVREAFWKQEPQIKNVLSEIASPRVFIVPLFISEGYFANEIIPRELGFRSISENVAAAILTANEEGMLLPIPRHNTRLEAAFTGRLGSPPPRFQTGSKVQGSKFKVQSALEQGRKFYYCAPVGTHDSMTKVILSRAREIVEQHPFPRAPQPQDTTLFIAGHGTEENEKSRQAIERQAGLIRALNLYAGVQAVYLEESPRIAACYTLAQTKNLVVVPFFISDGLHTQEDIPVLLGESQPVVRQRLAGGQPPWRNPTEKNGKLVWYAPAIGSDPHIAEVILERVWEAAGVVK
jgi:sirohydrochlorin cobaltochelatase